MWEAASGMKRGSEYGGGTGRGLLLRERRRVEGEEGDETGRDGTGERDDGCELAGVVFPRGKHEHILARGLFRQIGDCCGGERKGSSPHHPASLLHHHHHHHHHHHERTAGNGTAHATLLSADNEDRGFSPEIRDCGRTGKENEKDERI